MGLKIEIRILVYILSLFPTKFTLQAHVRIFVILPPLLPLRHLLISHAPKYHRRRSSL
jgi:hypothetical protein